MKMIWALLAVCVCSFVHGQEQKPSFDGPKWEAPYFLEKPAGWDIERFLIPMEFAPAIPYRGVEDVRFMPGWNRKGSGEYWSYAFLWYLDGKVDFTPAVLEKNLSAYYTGLLRINTDTSKFDTAKLQATTVSMRAIKRYAGDRKTFEGTVRTTDFMSREPLVLHFRIHLRSCEGQGKTIAFYEASPNPYAAPVWKSLDSLWAGFKCIKN